jgi:6-pyruvoyltetrahydropterin/6-carboxytetrahydropterin synthase
MRARVVRKIDFAHRLHNYDGKCSNIHGHTATVAVEFEGNINPETGMIADFKDLKDVVDTVIKPLDHALLLSERDEDVFKKIPTMKKILPFIPTAENLSEYIACSINGSIKMPHCVRVEFWETSNSCVIWEIDR